MKLADFSKIVNGTIAGDPETEIAGVSGIESARRGDITFLASPRFMKSARASQASCIIVKEPVEGISASQLIVSNPYYAFARAIEVFYPAPAFSPGVNGHAYVADTATLGENVSVYPFAYLDEHVSVGDHSVILPGVFIGKGSIIGEKCVLYPNVVVREGVRIGDRVIIHAGTVVGSDGYGYVFEGGEHYKIPQVGGVIIEDDVELGSNVSVDRGTIGDTVVGRGSKVDNLVQIAHNVRIGEKSLLVAQVAIGGSSEIGSFVTLAGQVGVADHSTIESGTMIGAQSGIAGSISKGAYSGSPAIPHRIWLRAQAAFSKLPDLTRKIRELEERIHKIEKENQR